MPPRKSTAAAAAASTTATTPSTPAKRRRGNVAIPPTPDTPSGQLEFPFDTHSAPTVNSLLGQSNTTADQWYFTKSTTTNYKNNVKAGKKWLESFTANPEAEGQDVEYSGDISALAGAFDAAKEETPLALRLWIAYKCEHQGCGFSTAESHRAAFKDHFERALGCQGDFWRYNSQLKTWEGNPVFQTDFKVYFESLKNRQSRTAVSNQALPMLPRDMKIIMDYLDTPAAAEDIPELQRVYFKAFATTAFNLWTRNEELVNFQYGELTPDQRSDSGQPYHEFRLIFRKTNKDPNKVQSYYVPPQTVVPELDCFTHLSVWLKALQTQLGRPLEARDYLFPAIATTGKLKFGEAMTRAGIERLLDLAVSKSGVMKGRNGKFTTHCFRRGGAQYRFMWAERRWSLKAVKWWGGWSSSENVGTIMRYLLDELMAYEEGFTDILMDNRSSMRHENFMGDPDPAAPISRSDLDMLEQKLGQRFEDLLLNSPAAARISNTFTMSNVSPIPSLLPALQQAQSSAMSTTPPDLPTMSSPTSNLGEPDDDNRMSTPPSPTGGDAQLDEALRLGSRPSRIPVTHSMDDVIRYWTKGDPAKGLILPLKDWPYTYGRKAYRSEEQKYSNIRVLYEEYSIHCEGDRYIFNDRYPGLWDRFTKVLSAVRLARKERGDTKSRQRRK